jgi:hypothetical protein
VSRWQRAKRRKARAARREKRRAARIARGEPVDDGYDHPADAVDDVADAFERAFSSLQDDGEGDGGGGTAHGGATSTPVRDGDAGPVAADGDDDSVAESAASCAKGSGAKREPRKLRDRKLVSVSRSLFVRLSASAKQERERARIASRAEC